MRVGGESDGRILVEQFMHTRVIASLIAVVGVQVFAAVAVVSLHRSEAWLRRALPYVISVAVGVLLATGVVHLLPEAVEALGNRSAVWVVVVLTMLGLYSFERIFHAFSGVSAEPAADAEAAHEKGHHHHHHASRPATLLLGSFMHSLVDGTGIAAAFATARGAASVGRLCAADSYGCFAGAGGSAGGRCGRVESAGMGVGGGARRS
jgi:zinc transporter ZupT